MSSSDKLPEKIRAREDNSQDDSPEDRKKPRREEDDDNDDDDANEHKASVDRRDNSLLTDREQLASMSRSERKKYREKKRREDVNKGCDELLAILTQVDETIREEIARRRRERKTSGDVDVVMSRADLIHSATGVIRRLHQENETRKELIKKLLPNQGGAVPGNLGQLGLQNLTGTSSSNPLTLSATGNVGNASSLAMQAYVGQNLSLSGQQDLLLGAGPSLDLDQRMQQQLAASGLGGALTAQQMLALRGSGRAITEGIDSELIRLILRQRQQPSTGLAPPQLLNASTLDQLRLLERQRLQGGSQQDQISRAVERFLREQQSRPR